jgi:hypothetical protein
MTASPRKRVGFRVLFPGFVNERKVVFTQFQRLPSLSSIELLGGGEVLQIFVVGPDFKLQLTALQIVSPFVEGPHDRQHFLVVDVVVLFGVVWSLGHKCNWNPDPVLALCQACPHGLI